MLSALVGFHTDMRHWSEAVAAIERFVGTSAASPADRLAALMRRAAIHADCEMDIRAALREPQLQERVDT